MTLRMVLGVLGGVLVGCAHGPYAGMFSGEPSMEARCRVGASQTGVLVTEWPASEKANLEAMLAGGAVAVQFSGCTMRVVPQCRLGGTYAWQRTTPSTDYIEIRSQADLYTKLPLGAAELSGELQRTGSLQIQTTVAGQRRLDGLTGADVPNRPECDEATHVVTALTLGAFAMSSGTSTQVSGSASVASIGQGGGSYSRSGSLVRSAGNAQACAGATGEAPAGDCSSPIQVFLSPIPGRGEPMGPPGTVKVDFVSASASTRWDVYLDDQATCTTPCSRWVDPSRPVLLRTRDDAPDKVRVPELDPRSGPLQVAARPLDRGELATGIVGTTFGGIALATGITLAAIGCTSDGHGGMCTAGWITLAGGAPLTYGGIWLIQHARARYGVRPLFGRAPGGGMSVGLAGEF